MAKVLVVDDHVDVASLLAALVISMGQDARFTTSCIDALPIAEEFQPDVVFVDIDMPRVGGLECARLLRGLLRDEVRMFGMSCYPLEDWPDRPQGFERYLLKPVLGKTLREILSE